VRALDDFLQHPDALEARLQVGWALAALGLVALIRGASGDMAGAVALAQFGPEFGNASPSLVALGYCSCAER